MRILILTVMTAILALANCSDNITRPEDDPPPNDSSLTVLIDTGDTIGDTTASDSGNYEIAIEVKQDVIQGWFTWLDITMNRQAATIGGYDFLISYDTRALTLMKVSDKGSPFADSCQWEYFTYRVGIHTGCIENCPDGLVRVVALAETNNGPTHPLTPCIAENGLLFKLQFFVTNDRTHEGEWLPVRFFWNDCTDNAMADPSGDTLFISNSIHNWNPEWHDYVDVSNLYPDSTLPTHYGPTTACDPDEGSEIYPYIDYYNGGFEIIGPESIDPGGDINLDGLSYTIADAVMFSDYFIEDTAALVYVSTPNQYGEIPGYSYSIENSDVNKNGTPLELADMVALINVIHGEALPGRGQPPTVDAHLQVNNGILSVDKSMGAAFMKFEGDITPGLLADSMEMKYGFDGTYTRVLVWSLEGHSFSGGFIQANADLVYIELTTPEAELVNVVLPPTEILLEQNDPNPFTEFTTIRFAIPERLECKVDIIRVADSKLVATFSSWFSAGYVSIRWDATGFDPGDYFFRLIADGVIKEITMTLVE